MSSSECFSGVDYSLFKEDVLPLVTSISLLILLSVPFVILLYSSGIWYQTCLLTYFGWLFFIESFLNMFEVSVRSSSIEKIRQGRSV